MSSRAEQMVGLDTSVILRLLVGLPEDQAERAKAFLDELFECDLRPVVSDLVLAETYYALQYHYGISKRDALQAIAEMLECGEVVGLGAAAHVLQTANLATARPGFVDRLICEQYRQAGTTMATFERAAKKITGTRLV